jgi:hypothetical protein
MAPWTRDGAQPEILRALCGKLAVQQSRGLANLDEVSVRDAPE